MAALGLTRSVPVTFAEAEAVIDEDSHGEADGNPDGLTRVYVSPEVDGWTLVIGWWCDPCSSERGEEVLCVCSELSARYGRAQAYYYGAQGDGSAWLIAEQGTVLRRYSATGEAEDALFTLGEPLKLERTRREHMGLAPAWDEAVRDDEAEDEWKWAAFGLAPEIAEALGISPLALTPATQVNGTGLLALTPHTQQCDSHDGQGPRLGR